MIESPISDAKLQALGVTHEKMLERIRSAVSFATAAGIKVAFFGVDSSRAELDFYRRAYETAVEAGAQEVVVVDTIGVATPEAAAYLVGAAPTLIDPEQPGSVNQIGSERIAHRLSSIPGRSLQDLVNSQPGWLYEGNAVLHPRGSEYQTQFVVDGVPLTDNRSPSFGPEIEADDVQSLTMYTAGIPAEYGRKMGGVVEVNTIRDVQPGFHGDVVLSGGSFNTAGAFAKAQFTRGKNTLGGSATGSRTDHYLNPVVPQNYSNTGTLGDFALHYQHDSTSNDRVGLSVRHALSRYDIPNEQLQEAAGQRQTAQDIETMGIAWYEHIYSPRTLGAVRGMVRDKADDFQSNPQSTPIEVFQHNSLRDGYFNAMLTADRGRSEWKVGVEADNAMVHENTSYVITDPSRFESGTEPNFAFRDERPDLEQAAFIQDLIRIGSWTISAGLRWDHYQLVVNKHALEPRFSIARYLPSANVVLHFSYDRVFQTPSFQNILLSSSTQVESLNPESSCACPWSRHKATITRLASRKPCVARSSWTSTTSAAW